MYINKVTLYGNLTRDPELKSLPSGQQVSSFSLATNRSYKDKEGHQQENTEFHNVVAFGRQAEIIGQYFKKGRPIYVEGRLQTRSWEKDGSKLYRTEIIIEQFQFRADSGATSTQRDTAHKGDVARVREPLAEEFDEEINPEDIPF